MMSKRVLQFGACTLFRQQQTYQTAIRSFHLMQSASRNVMMMRSLSMTPLMGFSLPLRSMFTVQRTLMMNKMITYPQQMSQIVSQPASRDFSLKMRKVKAKFARVKKFKLKTKKAFQKRFEICGSIRNKMFKFHAQGYRHLNRNKTNQNLKRTRARFLQNLADVKKAKKYMPYYKRRKYLSV